MAAPTNHWKLGLFVVVGIVLSLTTITFLGEQQDITDLKRRCLLPDRRRNADVLSAISQSMTCRVTRTRSPAGPPPNPGSMAVPLRVGGPKVPFEEWRYWTHVL